MNLLPAQQGRSSGHHMLHGTIWMVLLRWSIRLIGVFGTILLARLLSPSDFGIVAMAMFVVGMLEVLNQTGQKLALIRLTEPTREDYDTAWTISVLLGIVIAVLILSLAPFSKIYFHEPRAVYVMECLALRAVIGGLENIGTVDFRRNLNFERVFSYNVYPKLISFAATLVFAWMLRSYWALVVGILVGQLSTTILSYVLHPYRPKFSLAKLSHLWSFSFWTFFRSLGIYLNQQVDRVVVGGASGAAAMGQYSVASDVSGSPTQEINGPIITVLYPVMAKLQGNLTELRLLFLRTVGWSAIVCVSTSVGVALIAPEIVQLLLGPKWIEIVPLVGWLAFSAGCLGISSSAYVLFDAIGEPQIGAKMQWVRLLLLVLAIVPIGFATRNPTALAIARFVLTLIFMPTLLFVAGRYANIKPLDYLHIFWRPVLATIVMATLVRLVDGAISLPGIAKLALDVFVGSISFVSVLLLLWLVSGRPMSPERDIVGLLNNEWRRLTSKLFC